MSNTDKDGDSHMGTAPQGDKSNEVKSTSRSRTRADPHQGKTVSFMVCGTRFDVDARYKLIKPIGHGAYGVVCSAEDLKTGQRVAIKKLTIFKNDTLIETKRALREILLLSHFHHANVLKILDIMKPPSYEDFRHIYIVTELLSTDLHQIIASKQELSDQHIQYFMYQLLRGLKFIHSAKVIHRDLKPSNLLVNANCDLKVCDFGLARMKDPDDSQVDFLTEYVATRWYRAPEIMLSWKRYTEAVDMWSVGCILAELLGRKPLLPGKDYMHQLHLILELLGTPSFKDTEYIASRNAKSYIRQLKLTKGKSFEKLFPKASNLALDLLRKLLTFSPVKRLTVDQALSHPYLKLLHDPKDEPECKAKFDFSFEAVPADKGLLKALLWNEIAKVHPELSEYSDAPDMELLESAIKDHVQKVRALQREQRRKQKEKQSGAKDGDNGKSGRDHVVKMEE